MGKQIWGSEQQWYALHEQSKQTDGGTPNTSLQRTACSGGNADICYEVRAVVTLVPLSWAAAEFGRSARFVSSILINPWLG
jgi:hypothetical protein